MRRRFAERRKTAGMRKEAPAGAAPGFESAAVGREPVRPRMARRPGAGSAGARAETVRAGRAPRHYRRYSHRPCRHAPKDLPGRPDGRRRGARTAEGPAHNDRLCAAVGRETSCGALVTYSCSGRRACRDGAGGPCNRTGFGPRPSGKLEWTCPFAPRARGPSSC